MGRGWGGAEMGREKEKDRDRERQSENGSIRKSIKSIDPSCSVCFSTGKGSRNELTKVVCPQFGQQAVSLVRTALLKLIACVSTGQTSDKNSKGDKLMSAPVTDTSVVRFPKHVIHKYINVND